MANTVTVAVPLAGGLDTKTDSKVVLPGKMTVLENGDFTKGRSLRWRKGYVNVPAADDTGAPITDAHSVAPLNDGWVLLGRTNAYMLDRVKNAWSRLGPYTPIKHTEREVAFSSVKQTNADMDTVNGVTAVAWEDSRGGIRCTIYDEASGAAMVSEYELASANAVKPRVVAVGSNLLITWFNSSTTAIVARVVHTTDVIGSVAAANVTLAADAHANGQYDMTGGDGVAYLAFRQDPAVADDLRVFIVNPAGTVVLTKTIAVVASSGPVLAWNNQGNGLFLGYVDNGSTNLLVYKLSGSDLVTLAFDTAVFATGAVPFAISPLADGGITVWTQSTAGGASTGIVTITTHNEALDTKAVVGDIRHAEIASTGFTDGVNSYCILRYNDSNLSNLQNTFFIYRTDAVVVGRILPGEADGTTSWLPRVKTTTEDNKFMVALGFKRQVRVNLDKITGVGKQTPVFEHQGVQRCDLDTAAEVHAAEIDGVLYTSGGMMWSIDGAGAPTESQFLLFPDQVASSLAVSVGGNLTVSSTYSYRIYYEWTNARGQRVRSLALTLTAATNATDKTVTITLQTLTHGRMQGRSPVSIVVYRSLANRTDFHHRVSSSNPTVGGNNGYVANITNANTVSFVDVLSDVNAEQQEIDYISEGETDHFAFDAPAVVAAVGNRVFCGGGGRFPNRPQFSLLRRDGRPVETNDTWTVSEFPEFGGALTGFSDMNGVPLAFKERAIYAIEGNGPTNQRGALNDYRASAITTDVGCTDPKSLVQIPPGIMFKSAKGVYLLDQSLNLEYIGAMVEKYNGQTITGAEVIPDTNMVVFITESGVALMYDYYYKEWGVYTNHEGKASAVTNTDYAYLRNNGELYIRDESLYADAGIPYGLHFKTAPLHLEDTVQGFDKMVKFQVLGEYASDHTLEVALYYNRDREPYQTMTFKPGDILDLTVWGESTPWGSSTPWGGDWSADDYNFEIKPKRSKFSTISFDFRGLPGTAPGAGFELTELLLECKVRGGPMRLPARRKL